MSRGGLVILVFIGTIALTVSWLSPRLQVPQDRFSVAMDLIADGRAADAVHLLDERTWRGVAEYRAGRFRRAATEFVEAESVTGLYNLGTANARLGEWAAARAAYERALEIAPGHEDAAFNLALVLQAEARQRQDEESQRDTRTLGAEKGSPGFNDGEGDADSEKTTTDGAIPSESAAPTEKPATRAGQMSSEGRTGETPTSDDAAAGRGTFADAEEREASGQTGAGGIRLREQSAQNAEILLRAIRDDPARVLRARLRAIHRQREAGRR